ncbi:hypothetical protein MCUN1_000673 [Malassezia cuniculi]|uniref:Uncharacterized protein n=1 Tax=Malassezia cuniculi TaxID=948313 RepID=A0AAF0EPD6_9BASI|nr:hypothetical protein MCUN1_000673 [Malassezia cuniculi]
MSSQLSTQAAGGDGAEEAASRYMNELAARLLGSIDSGAGASAPFHPAPATTATAATAAVAAAHTEEAAPSIPSEPSTSALTLPETTNDLGAAAAASLERFMASLKTHLDLPADWTDPVGSSRRRRLHDWDYDQVCEHVRRAIMDHMAGRRVLTTIRCLHASVAQKSYGTEKRFLCPPPAVHITGPLRHRHSAPSLCMQVQGEDGESMSGEQLALLDDTAHARFTELHVTGTGKSKYFRLHLHLLSPRQTRMHDTKRLKTLHSDTTSWASFDSAPIGIISKPSKKTAKARNAAAHISGNTLVSLFNRINSQTIRTKYLYSNGGRLSAQSRTWSAFRLVIVTRPPAHSGADDGVLTYGSTIALVDTESGASTEPLIVCKVDRGRVLPPVGSSAALSDDNDELSPYGTVSQMQKVALLRLDEQKGARHYLCAGTPLHADAPPEDTHTLPLTFSEPAATHHAGMGVVIDEVDDTFSWTLVGISHFEYSFIDVDTLDATTGDVAAGLALTPFPIVTTMPFYDAQTHKLATSVQHFYYCAQTAAFQTAGIAAAAAAAHGTHGLQPLEAWLGPLGPLALAAQPRPEKPDETEIAVQLPQLTELLGARPADSEPSQCVLPLLFVRSFDGTVFHSGRSVVCQDLVAIVSAAGDVGAANALKKLNVGLGERAGAHKVPGGGAWTIRIV